MASQVTPETARQHPRWWPLWLLALLTCAVLPLLTQRAALAGDEPAAQSREEWPRELDGQTLRPLALSDVERRFAARFPGQIGRFSSGAATVTLRIARRPTRMLHPAVDCYQGLGYRIRDSRLESDSQSRLWRCFTAWRDGKAVRVCERIEGKDGQTFTDTSAWYWAAALGRTAGPWLAVTRAERLQP